jgi:predicted methyltransferase MtxX (methanogen marker protein 4)
MIRDVLRNQLYALRNAEILHREWTANPAGLAALALDAAKGNASEALKMLVNAAHYLRRVQKEEAVGVQAQERVQDSEACASAEWDKIFP